MQNHQAGQAVPGKARLSGRDKLALVGLACAAFIFNTSEFIPIGLLSDIARDFGVTEARAGLLISVYAWAVMLLSLPLMLLVSRVELKRLMVGLTLLFAVFQLFSAAAPGYYALMLARIGVACTHAVFWSIVSPLAARLVPDRFRPLALSVIVTGSSVAMVFGLPLGRVIGLYVGWRTTFQCIGVFAFLVCVYLACVLPRVPSRGGFSPRKLPVLLKNPLLVGIYALTLGVAGAYFTGYSYIEPFLKQVAGMTDEGVTATLMLFGGMGIAGSVAFSRWYGRYARGFMTLVLLGMAASLALLRPAAELVPAVVSLCALWGMVATAFNVSLQSEIIAHSPQDATAVSMSIFSGIFNLGIGCGTWVGGVACTHLSIASVGYVGGAIALAAFAFWRWRVSRLLAVAKGV